MNSISYYQSLIQYLYSLQSQISSLTLSQQEENSLRNAIERLIQLSRQQIEELYQDEYQL